MIRRKLRESDFSKYWDVKHRYWHTLRRTGRRDTLAAIGKYSDSTFYMLARLLNRLKRVKDERT